MRRQRQQVAALIPTWRHLLGQGGNFSFAGIPLHFADCRDNCRLPPFWLFAANSRRINLISPSSVHRPCCLGLVPRCEMV